MNIHIYEMGFENDEGEWLDVTFYPLEGWINLSTDGKKEGFSVSSLQEWKTIDKTITKFFDNYEKH